ncbi:Lrp/AsnC family transcriptional regulator [Ktedonosporobacter rubrisoli]|uniref:Lrp/AsnC family transcriptional regulator n=1 Tax=Ktedonosporobacter rubrisoli TaxID=2509675 RepID=A0A4P6JVY3_KTERU|nr:Lrp/AsnC family transcriptional regulator [Ktedonosporobacter rubrisoli]QBD79839.1 Lrp/AsnC family transcriptional regulator [Ktedonosporobacter rubrisoli]
MTAETEKLLDDTGWQLLQAMQRNARLSFSELGKQVGLSASAVAERIRRMEDAGIIRGYRVEIDPARVGLPIMAFIHINTPSNKPYSYFAAAAKEIAEVLECHQITGSDSMIMKVAVSSVKHLETLISRLSVYGRPTTSIVLSTQVAQGFITPQSLLDAQAAEREETQK